MSNAGAIITASGFGKSTSLGHISKDEVPGMEYDIMGVNPLETFLVNIKGKPLPFRGWKKGYNPVLLTEPPVKANYLASTDPQFIMKNMDFVDANRPDVKNFIIDDFQYMMAEEFVANALKAGYDKFSKLAKNAYDVINRGLKMRSDINFFILTHSDEDNKGNLKMKTIGKMLDEKVTLEGLFTVILYGKSTYDPTEKRSKKQYVTNFDGEFPAKSPIGMFKELYIPNDMGLVIKTMNDYYNGE